MLPVPDTVCRAQKIMTVCIVLEAGFLEEVYSIGLGDKQKAKALQISEEHQSQAGGLLGPDI